MLVRAFALAAGLLVASVALAADKPGPNDWPQWRGPNRDGLNRETGLLQSWPKDGPPVVWTAKNLGLGFGTPSVACGKIFGIGSRNGQDGVWALKEADGSELWFTPFSKTAAVAKNTNGPASTPTYHDGKVYTVSLGGSLVCMDATTGKAVWQKEYTGDEFGGKVPTWGYSESVLIDGDKLICIPAGTKAAVAALNPATGAVIWKTTVPAVGGGAGYSSAVKTTVGGIPMYVALLGDAGGIVGVHADTGKLLWQYNKTGFGGVAQIPTPVVTGDKVWWSTSYPKGGSALLQLVPEGKDKVEVKELKAYKKPELNNHHGGMVLVGDHIYFGHDQNNGIPVCVDAKTGEIVWKADKAPGGRSAAYLYADGRLYVRYENRLMTLVKPSPKEDEAKVVSSFMLPEADVKQYTQSWPHPVIANGKLYIRDQNALYCYNIKAATN